MGDVWLSRPELAASSEAGVEAAVDIPADAPWFSGHFPGRPVLPGVVWLYAAAEVVRENARRGGRPVEIAGFRNVRFRARVVGAARAVIVVGPAVGARAGELRFEVRIDGEPVCRGLIAVRYPAGEGA
ncbi:MAG: hypothetical protein HY907_14045 [Deltaproteobacteria bacterium]|nr:hypothetical protein [Deltaproteobacteria bacterium]